MIALIAAAGMALVLIPVSAKAAGGASGVCSNLVAAAPHTTFGPNSWFVPAGTTVPTSFTEDSNQRVATYPLYRGTSGGSPVEYVITDASDLAVARDLGVMYAPKLKAAEGTAAVQGSTSQIMNGGGIDFPATVNFSATRTLTPSPAGSRGQDEGDGSTGDSDDTTPDGGFPPATATPGPVGNTGYSPLVKVSFRGHNVVLNAPQLANSTGQHPKLTAPITDASTTASLSETFGCFDLLSVHYVSFDASDPVVAAIENATYAPALNSAPSAGCADSTNPTDGNPPAPPTPNGCARESLAAFTNGPTPIPNQQWQGLNNSLLTLECGFSEAGTCTGGTEISPFNVLKGVPTPTLRFEYSPLWDPHLSTWTSFATLHGISIRVGLFQDVRQEAALGFVTAPNGSAWAASGFIVNCPPVSLDVPTGDVPTG